MRPSQRITALAIAIAVPMAMAIEATAQGKETPAQKLLSERGSLAFVDVDVYVGDGSKLEKVTVLVEDGKIQKVGKDLAVPRSAKRIEGGVLTPGFVMLGSTAGVRGGAPVPRNDQVIIVQGRRGRGRPMPTGPSSSAAPFTPNVKVSDRLDPKSKELADWLEAGVTTHGVRPPTSGLSGLGAAIRPVGDEASDLVLQDETFAWLGMTANTKTKKSIREGFEKAKELIEQRKKAKAEAKKPATPPAAKAGAAKPEEAKKEGAKPGEGEKPKPDPKPQPNPTPDPKPTPKPTPQPKPNEPPQGKPAANKSQGKDDAKKPAAPKEDPRHAVLAQSLEGERKVLLGVSGPGELLHALQALDGFELPLVVMHTFRRGEDATLDLVSEQLAKTKATVVCTVDLGSKPATAILTNPIARLQKAGLTMALVPGTRPSEAQEVWYRLGELMRTGLEPGKLIEAMTLTPAKVLGVDKQVGSIEKDKDANFLHFSHDPFGPTARLEHVYFEGREVKNVKTKHGS
ncbi:MAG: amidohydrolase family protein [Planctomycetes bacterium]|nr:amidohydrolase family protein [Planctomycetota bacterium]